MSIIVTITTITCTIDKLYKSNENERLSNKEDNIWCLCKGLAVMKLCCKSYYQIRVTPTDPGHGYLQSEVAPTDPMQSLTDSCTLHHQHLAPYELRDPNLPRLAPRTENLQQHQWPSSNEMDDSERDHMFVGRTPNGGVKY